jgi:hypothetical protein
MELMTGYSALDALGRPLSEVLGFYHSEYVRRCHVSTLLHVPWPWCVSRLFCCTYHVAGYLRCRGQLLCALGTCCSNAHKPRSFPLCLSRRKDFFPYKHPAIIVRKDGKMLVAMAYFEPIRSPNAWFYNHVIVWYNQFRPFDPVKIE